MLPSERKPADQSQHALSVHSTDLNENERFLREKGSASDSDGNGKYFFSVLYKLSLKAELRDH